MRGEMFEHKVAHFLGIAGCDVDDEVFGATEEEELQHLREAMQLVTELSDVLASTRANAYADEHLKVKTDGSGSNLC